MSAQKKLHRRDAIKATAAASTIALASQITPIAYATAKEGWIKLFNGKNLDGWHINPEKIGHGTGGQWAVEKGTIAGQQDPPGSGNGGILLTDKKFGDFELKIGMKPDWGVCSGLFLRGNDRGACFQMMVDYHDAGNVGHIYGEGTTGFNTRTFDINGKYDGKKLTGLMTDKHKAAKDVGLIYSCTPEEFVSAWKVNEWNMATVKVQGEFPKITTWVNDLKVCEFDGESSTAANYDKEKIKGILGTSGSIAVQVHGGTGWPKGAKCRWKDISIRPL